MTIRPDMTAEEAWREYRKSGEAVEDFESFKERWEGMRKRKLESYDDRDRR